MPYVTALDGLRGAAIAAVLLFHTGLLPGGFLGVDLFFVLSGYLITALLLREVRQTGRVALVAFWGRRLRRLGPALMVMLVTVSVTTWVIAPNDLVKTTLSDGPWVQLNLINWRLLAESASYWDRFGSVRVFEHLWSIAVEEQFYLVWPVLVLLIAMSVRNAERGVVTVAALVSGASLVAMITLFDAGDPTRVYIGTDSRAFSLLVGAVVAAPAVRRSVDYAVGKWAGPVMALLATWIVAVWLLVEGPDSPGLFTGGLFAHSVACGLLICLCVERQDTRTARMFAWNPLRRLGLISYGVYLWHWPVAVLLPVIGVTGWAATLGVVVGSIGIAALSKRLIEDPIRFRSRWARGKSGGIVAAAVMLAVAAMWWVLPAPPPPVIDITEL